MSFAYWTAKSGYLSNAVNWSNNAIPDASTSLFVGVGGNPYFLGDGRTSKSLTVASLVLARDTSTQISGVVMRVGPESWAEYPTTLTCGYLYNDGTVSLGLATYLNRLDAASSFQNFGTLLVNGNSQNIGTSIALAFNNQGSLVVGSAGLLAISSIQNLSSGVLIGGDWTVAGKATFGGDAIAELGAGATVTLSGANASLTAGGLAIESTLTTIDAGATLAVTGGRVYTTSQALQVDGTLQLGGGTISPIELTVSASGRIAGYGAIGATAVVHGELATVSGAGALTVGSALLLDDGHVTGKGVLANAGLLMLQNATVASRMLDNDATILVTGDTTISAKLVNDGVVNFGDRTLTLANTVSGHGAIHLTDTGTLHFIGGVGSGQTVALDGRNDSHGTLQIDKASAFKATITDFDAGDTIDLRELDWHEGYVIGWNAKTDRLTISDGADMVRLRIDGDFVLDGFHLADDGHGGTMLTYADSAASQPADAPFVVEACSGHAWPPAEIAALV